MKNFEKYIDEILGNDGTDCFLRSLRIANNACACNCNRVCDECYKSSKKWLLQEFEEPYKLTILEYEILKRYKGYDVWIGFDPVTKHRYLRANNLDGMIFACGDDAFGFMNTERKYVVNEILSNYEVIDNVD